MKWMHAIVAAGALMVASPALAQQQQQPPQTCMANAQGATDWTACLRDSPADAPWRPLVLINLGSEALMRQDYSAAAGYYDQAAPPGSQVMSDAAFHAFRSVAYWHTGRNDEALRDAQLVHRMLLRDPTLPIPPERYLPPQAQPDILYAFILPVFKALNAPELQPALTEFMALPATDWVGYANRSAVLLEVGDPQAALTMNTRALELAPNEPAALNNHCYIMFTLQRAADALPYCQRAVAGAPQVGAAHHSLASVFAALGRCADSEREIGEARRLDPATVEYQRPIACTAR